MESKTFLIIEDDTKVADLLGELLVAHFNDCRVVYADTIRLAASKLLNQRFSLIFSDLNLPGGSGTELVSALRSNKSHPNQKTPIIVLSGSLTKTIRNEIGNEIESFIEKPWDEMELLNAVKKVCY